ncbi:MAG: hypothetical protein JWM10_85 [Myxococcaceae bacterium]|nr:hypothetical protein [Myxococcaceae bacterium]
MIDQSTDALDTMRTLTTELLSSIDMWSGREADPQHFRHRLLRAHALAVLDEIEQITVPRASRQVDAVR